MAEFDKSLEYISQTQTLVGQKKRELLDRETGEIIWVDQITKRTYGTKNFWKCYLIDFLSVLGFIDSKQLDIFIYIVERFKQFVSALRTPFFAQFFYTLFNRYSVLNHIGKRLYVNIV